MKKGFTLVEVIVSIAIMAIVGVMVSTIFVTLSKYESRKNEINNINSHLIQIHEIYLSEPTNWLSTYKSLYYLAEDLALRGDEDLIYYSKDFKEVVSYETEFYIKFDYKIENDITSLEILEIRRGTTLIGESINLGTFKEVTT